MSTKSDKTIRKIVVGASIGAALLLGGCKWVSNEEIEKAKAKYEKTVDCVFETITHNLEHLLETSRRSFGSGVDSTYFGT